MAIQRKIKTFSGTEEQMKRLRKVSTEMGLKESELINYCIKKVEGDKTMREMILADFLEENKDKLGRIRLLRIMSIRKELKKSKGFNQPMDCRILTSTYKRRLHYLTNKSNLENVNLSIDEVNEIRCLEAMLGARAYQ